MNDYDYSQKEVDALNAEIAEWKRFPYINSKRFKDNVLDRLGNNNPRDNAFHEVLNEFNFACFLKSKNISFEYEKPVAVGVKSEDFCFDNFSFSLKTIHIKKSEKTVHAKFVNMESNLTENGAKKLSNNCKLEHGSGEINLKVEEYLPGLFVREACTTSSDYTDDEFYYKQTIWGHIGNFNDKEIGDVHKCILFFTETLATTSCYFIEISSRYFNNEPLQYDKYRYPMTFKNKRSIVGIFSIRVPYNKLLWHSKIPGIMYFSGGIGLKIEELEKILNFKFQHPAK